MPDIYINLSHPQYKEVERQMKAFKETTHGEGTDYYHKSFAMDVGGIRFEFHGPPVKARQPAASEVELCAVKFLPAPGEPSVDCDMLMSHPGEHSWAEFARERPRKGLEDKGL